MPFSEFLDALLICFTAWLVADCESKKARAIFIASLALAICGYISTIVTRLADN